MTSRRLPLACIAVAVLVCSAEHVARGQDTAAAPSPAADTAWSRLERLRSLASAVGHASLSVAQRAERILFDTDSTVAHWSLHNDPASRALRAASPIAFWVPVATVATLPLIWADEAQDNHALNAQYARNTTAGLVLGFVASRLTKRFIHRARPCTGAEPDDISLQPVPDTSARCPRRSYVTSYSSFFSEHTMALFSIAASSTFQAERRNAPNATMIAAVGFSSATLFSVARIYQRHHWLTDVLAGAAVGTASGFVAAQLAPAARRP